jgi:hypothetical protein
LAAHAHPSVAAMARTLLAGTTVMYDGDPLRNLTLAAFLDKFVQKKPKVWPVGKPTARSCLTFIPSLCMTGHPFRAFSFDFRIKNILFAYSYRIVHFVLISPSFTYRSPSGLFLVAL